MGQARAGQRVWITNTQEMAMELRKADTPRSYVVEIDSEEVRRNKAHLRPLPDIQSPAAPDIQSPTENVGDTEQIAALQVRVGEEGGESTSMAQRLCRSV